MTDQHEPEKSTREPDGDRPTAGRRRGPAAAEEVAAGHTTPATDPARATGAADLTQTTPAERQATPAERPVPGGRPPTAGGPSNEEPTVAMSPVWPRGSVGEESARPGGSVGEESVRPGGSVGEEATVAIGPAGEVPAGEVPAGEVPAGEVPAGEPARDVVADQRDDRAGAAPTDAAEAAAITADAAAVADAAVVAESAAVADAAMTGGVGATGPGAGSLDVVNPGAHPARLSPGRREPVQDDGVDLSEPKPRRRLSPAGALIWLLLALFGFTLVVQLRSNNADEGLATARQEDLVRILSDLEARDQRLQAETATLEQSQRQLTSGVEGRQAALAEAQKRADELGLLAGTLPGRGPGLKITIDPKGDAVKASAVLNAVQELRGAGGEVMEVAGADGTPVRIVASTYFVDADGGGIVVDGRRMIGPYTLFVIGVPQTMQTALQIPGGVVASVNSAGGSVTMEPRSMVEVTAVRGATSLRYARPVS